MINDPRDRKIIFAGAIVLAALIVLALFVPNDQPEESGVPSSYSAGSGGAKAAYTLLEQEGYEISRWTDVPQMLPEEPAGTTLVLAVPTDAPTETERAAIANFARKGGHVLAVGPSALAIFSDLDKTLSPTSTANTRRRYRALLPGRNARAVPEITMAAGRTWQASPGQLPLYGNDSNSAVVVTIPYGKGDIVWWASATPLTNSGLREAGNIELLLNSVGEPGTRVLWDEYLHGLQQGVGHLLAQTPLPWALVQCGIVLLAAMLTLSRRSGPIHDPVEPPRLSPLEYAETLGGLYRRAKASEVAVQVALERFRMLAGRKLGLRAEMTRESLYAALQSRCQFNDVEFVGVLRECEAVRSDPKLDRHTALKLTRALHDYSVRLKFVGGLGEKL